MNGTATTTNGTGLPASPDAPPPRFDFPTWLPPMLVKELRQGLRQRGFVGGLIVVQAILLIVFVWGFVMESGNGSSRSLIDGFFWAMMGFVLLTAAPLRALSGLSAELDSRTMDLLLLTRLDAWRIVWGKWVSLMTQTVLLAVTLLPYAVVRYFFGAVDLVTDFGVIAGLLAGGAVLTAVALWASGLPRVLRVLMTIVAVIAMFYSVNVFGMMRHGSVSFSGGATSAWLAWLQCLWAAALVLLYFLALAVRWFAPPAENHAILPRLIPLGFLAPIPVLAMSGFVTEAAEQTGVALAGLGMAAAVELAGTREVMTIHLRGWMARGGWRSALGPLFLPGWPSACGWLAAMAVLVVAGWSVADLASVKDLKFPEFAWLAVLGWAGLVFPILLVSLVPTVGRVAGVLYFALQGILGIFAAMAGNSDLSRLVPTSMLIMDWISHSVPTTSFWHALVEIGKPSDLPAVGFGQAVGVAVTLALMLWQARPYWDRVRAMRHQIARERADTAQ